MPTVCRYRFVDAMAGSSIIDGDVRSLSGGERGARVPRLPRAAMRRRAARQRPRARFQRYTTAIHSAAPIAADVMIKRGMPDMLLHLLIDAAVRYQVLFFRPMKFPCLLPRD